MLYRPMAAAALCASLAFLPVLGAAQGISVEGALDCGQWSAARTKERAGYFEHYLLGLLNGMALGKRIEFWHAGGRSSPSREAVYLWMDKYCRENPLSHFITGAFELFAERTTTRP